MVLICTSQKQSDSENIMKLLRIIWQFKCTSKRGHCN